MSEKHLGTDWSCDVCDKVIHTKDDCRPRNEINSIQVIPSGWKEYSHFLHVCTDYSHFLHVCTDCWPEYLNHSPNITQKKNLIKKLFTFFGAKK